MVNSRNMQSKVKGCVFRYIKNYPVFTCNRGSCEEDLCQQYHQHSDELILFFINIFSPA